MTSLRTLCVLACCVALLPVPAGFAAERSPERVGKAIYLKGGPGLSPAITALVSGGSSRRASEGFACAACHGVRGQGGAEAGLRVPPIDARSLAASRVGGGSGYNSAALLRAVRSGLDPSGVPLSPAMPRYDLDDRQAAALASYLAVLDTASDIDPGITPDGIKVGTVLPMSGALADAGAAIAASLQARFDAANAAGGIYGRRVRLLVADSRSDPAQAAIALRRMIESEGVFALVGSVLVQDDPALDVLIAEENVPVIGPVAPPPTEAQARAAGPWHLLPTWHDQARVLVDDAHARQGPFRAAIVAADTAQARDAADGARRQLDALASPSAQDTVADPDRIDAAQTIRRLYDDGVTWVFVFGDTRLLEGCARALATLPDQSRPRLGALASLSPAPHLPPSTETTVAVAVELPAGQQSATLAAALQSTGRTLTRPALQAVAYAAASVFLESVTRAGRQLGRAELERELGLLRRFDTGVMPVLDFTPNRHVGLRGALIVRIGNQGASYTPEGRFRAPTE